MIKYVVEYSLDSWEDSNCFKFRTMESATECIKSLQKQFSKLNYKLLKQTINTEILQEE
jgi:F0F1-type ATP synthase gamma subunit